MTRFSRDEALKILLDLTMMRASSVSRGDRGVPAGYPSPNGHPVVFVDVTGLAEPQRMDPRNLSGVCDGCSRGVSQDEAVVGKIVTWEDRTKGFIDGSMRGSTFVPTCIECFAEDKYELCSNSLARLVIEA